MVFRRPGGLLPLEEDLLAVIGQCGQQGIHGFALAQALAELRDQRALVAHGTLYKALDRLRGRGLLDASWEPAELAASAGRPRRRQYLLTAEGAHVLAAARAERTDPARMRTAPA